MKRCYVVQVYAGYENVVKSDILKSLKEHSIEDSVSEILIPSTKMKSFFESPDTAEDQQLFPGYLLVEMEPTPEVIRVISKTPRVVKFLGGSEPVPLTRKEEERVRAQIKGEMVVSGEKHPFEIGKEVEIKEGPFAGFIGRIEEIQEIQEKLVVQVSIFGRMTPVELSFDQVKR